MSKTTLGVMRAIVKCAQDNKLIIPDSTSALITNDRDDETVAPFESLKDLVSNTLQQNDCPQFPLLFGQWLVGKDTSLVGLICENSETLRESFEITQRFASYGQNKHPALASSYFVQYEEQDNTVVEINYQDKDYEPIGSEMIIARVVSSIRTTVRSDFPFIEVSFKHQKHCDLEHYQNVFNCSIKFGHHRNAMVFPTIALKEKVRTAQPYMKSILLEYASKLFDKFDSKPDFVSQVVENLIAGLIKGNPSLSYVSKAMAMSESSLQRRLKEHDTSFSQLLLNTRKDMAENYLKSGESITTTAFLLGFSDASAFSRAFKTWFGVSPKEYYKSTIN